MGRKKKAVGRTAAPKAPNNSEENKPRGRGRPRKYPVVAAVPESDSKEESQQSASSTADDQSQEAPLPEQPAAGTTDESGAIAVTAGSKKFGKFRILHSSSPSSSSGEQPSEFAIKSEEAPAPVEEVKVEELVAMEVDEPPIVVSADIEVATTEVATTEVATTEEVTTEEVTTEEVTTDEVTTEEVTTEEVSSEEEPKEQQQPLEGEIQRLQNLSIEPLVQVKEDIMENIVIEMKDEEPMEKEKEEPKSTVEANNANTESATPVQTDESTSSVRRRSSRIKVILESNVKTKPTKDSKEDKESKDKDVDANGQGKEQSESDFSTPSTPSTSIKPVKVKSRWRRSSELEMGSNNQSKSSSQGGTTASVPATPKISQPLSADEERLKNFKKIDKNLYLTQRTTNKETKRMICECEPVDDDEMGCGEDCLNRMLMIECGPRCPLGDKCSNKRFQKMEYSPIEVVRTEKKGFGLQAMADIEDGAFLSEYVGEVLDPYEFQNRAEDYANDKNRHYYFMALKSDAIIDATIKGNNSRFINHSCDPNAETQKWTVNGELRIGFFAIKNIAAGEEITFDYQLQRYGKEAQRCYCEAENCRGWIGGDPDKEETVTKKGTKTADKKDKKSKPKPKFYIVQELLEDQDLENEVKKLCNGGLKNKQSTLTFSRLMVRVDDQEKRKRLLELLQNAETPCRRLFLDYHGLRLMWSWMVDERNEIRLEIMNTLDRLPISNITVLQDTKVFGIIVKWEEESRPIETDSTKEDPEKKATAPLLAEEETVTVKNEPAEDILMEESAVKGEEAGEVKEGAPTEKVATVDEEANVAKPEETVEEASKTPEDEDASKEAAALKAERRAAENKIAKALLEIWKTLPEVFKIPRKVKKEQMKEHEREAERNYQKSLENRGYKAEYAESSDRARQERYRGASLIVSNFSSNFKRRDVKDDLRKPRMDRNEDRSTSGMSKFERRQLFAQRVEQEEREKQQQMWMEREAERRQQIRMMEQQQQQPHIQMDANGVPCFFDPTTNQWHVVHAPAILTKPAAEPPELQQPVLDPSVWQQVTHIPIPPLPPRWKAAYDDIGQPYFFHIRRRVPQWQPPPFPSAGSITSSDDSSSSSELTSSAESEESESSEEEESEDEPQELEEAEMEPSAPGEEESKVKDPSEDTKKPEEVESKEPRRREGLIKELIIISPRREEDIPTESTKARIRKAKEQLRLEKQAAMRKQHIQHRHKDKTREKQRTIKIKNTGGDIDVETEKKIKEDFLAKMATTVVSTLNPFHRPECQQGRITSSEDFKYLARKLTNFVMLKELKHCRKVSDLSCNDSVKHKAREYIKKYMAKFGEVYCRKEEREREKKEASGDPE
ncbi:Hypothetical predicted protein [Cloeon dipterum]|uniref:[histone H3]-lysine(36) N-trimethyltransferase n=1 Tax=Cloeon dipterum TaxID=197152 RepID=A0A8S1CUK0_9INSE|nr:Hypothetical predicted protein [Cloeon dipterum]